MNILVVIRHIRRHPNPSARQDVLYWYEPCRAWGQGLFGSSQQYHKEIHGWECSELVRR